MYPPAIHPTAAPAKGRGPSCRGRGPLKISKLLPLLKDSVQRTNGSRLAPGKRGEILLIASSIPIPSHTLRMTKI